MKGLQHNVIEINDTQSENIDKILVFLKPEASGVALMTTRAQAAEILKDLEIKPRKNPLKNRKLWLWAAAAITAIVLGAILFL